jgi:hypothetical protein
MRALRASWASTYKDAALDAALKAAGVAQITIRHQRAGAPPAIVPHWSFGESIRIYPITAGPPATTIGGCLRTSATAEAGIGLSWPAGEKSRMAVRALIMVGDAPTLVQLSVRSTMTDHLLAALLDHYRVCEAADKLIKRDQHPEMVAFHELALPLTAGNEIPAGRGETSQITPLRSDHPAAIEKAYISSCWRKNVVADAALAAWPGIVAWALGYRTGETNGDSHLDGGQGAGVLDAPPQRGYTVYRYVDEGDDGGDHKHDHSRKRENP